jgi:hypothetical protein
VHPRASAAWVTLKIGCSVKSFDIAIIPKLYRQR